MKYVVTNYISNEEFGISSIALSRNKVHELIKTYNEIDTYYRFKKRDWDNYSPNSIERNMYHKYTIKNDLDIKIDRGDIVQLIVDLKPVIYFMLI